MVPTARAAMGTCSSLVWPTERPVTTCGAIGVGCLVLHPERTTRRAARPTMKVLLKDGLFIAGPLDWPGSVFPSQIADRRRLACCRRQPASSWQCFVSGHLEREEGRLQWQRRIRSGLLGC